MKSLHIIPTTVFTLVFLTLSQATFAQEKEMNPIDKAIKLFNMETKHENAWKTLMKKYKPMKFDLMIKHTSEKDALKTKKMNEIKDKGFSEELVTKYTKECLALHKKHHGEWRELWEQKKAEKDKLSDDQMKEIEEFSALLETEKD